VGTTVLVPYLEEEKGIRSNLDVAYLAGGTTTTRKMRTDEEKRQLSISALKNEIGEEAVIATGPKPINAFHNNHVKEGPKPGETRIEIGDQDGSRGDLPPKFVRKGHPPADSTIPLIRRTGEVNSH